jgi:hypothetical protein
MLLQLQLGLAYVAYFTLEGFIFCYLILFVNSVVDILLFSCLNMILVFCLCMSLRLDHTGGGSTGEDAPLMREIEGNLACLPLESGYTAFDSVDTKVRDDAIRVRKVPGGFLVDVALVNPLLVMSYETAKRVRGVLGQVGLYSLNKFTFVPCNVVEFFVAGDGLEVCFLSSRFARVQLHSESVQAEFNDLPIAKLGQNLGSLDFWISSANCNLANVQKGVFGGREPNSYKRMFSPALRYPYVLKNLRRQLGLPGFDFGSADSLTSGEMASATIGFDLSLWGNGKKLSKEMLFYSDKGDFATYLNLIRGRFAQVFVGGFSLKDLDVKKPTFKVSGVLYGKNVECEGSGANKFVALKSLFEKFVKMI